MVLSRDTGGAKIARPSVSLREMGIISVSRRKRKRVRPKPLIAPQDLPDRVARPIPGEYPYSLLPTPYSLLPTPYSRGGDQWNC